MKPQWGFRNPQAGFHRRLLDDKEACRVVAVGQTVAHFVVHTDVCCCQRNHHPEMPKAFRAVLVRGLRGKHQGAGIVGRAREARLPEWH